MATDSSILAWRIPWMKELRRLQSIRLHRVRHDWSDWAPHWTESMLPRPHSNPTRRATPPSLLQVDNPGTVSSYLRPHVHPCLPNQSLLHFKVVPPHDPVHFPWLCLEAGRMKGGQTSISNQSSLWSSSRISDSSTWLPGFKYCLYYLLTVWSQGNYLISLNFIFSIYKTGFIMHWSHMMVFVFQLCLTLCDPTDCSTPDFPVLHCLPEFTQTHVHWVDDAI